MKNVVIFTKLGDFKVVNLPKFMKESEILKVVKGFIQEKENRIVTSMDIVDYRYMTESQYNKYLKNELEKGFATREELEKNYTIIDYKEL